MNTKLTFFVFLTLFGCISAFAQADLVLNYETYSPNLVNRGGFVTIQAEMTNIGNATAAQNYVLIYFSKDLTASFGEVVGRLSVKELAPNESQELFFHHPIPPDFSTGDYHILFSLDPYDFVTESDEENLYCSSSDGVNCTTFFVNNILETYQKYTYPILFVHGWTGNSIDTWEDLVETIRKDYGMSFGGRFDYCLNPDGNQSTSDGFVRYFPNSAELRNGDYYLLNFDVGTEGEPFVASDLFPFNDSYSNQSAIIKQGWAIRETIQDIIELTGTDKVILVGHSMGGLASREYLQNRNNWLGYGEHFVGKLLTIDTPNGGSNLSKLNFGVFFGFDENSDAVRDFRYPNGNWKGQFLFGGKEEFNPTFFHNDDVNCDGYVGDNIVGLNEKVIPSDIDYSCMIAKGTDFFNHVVEDSRADLNNYPFNIPANAGLHAEKFDSNSNHSSIQNENPDLIIQALDEPDDYNKAYPLTGNVLNYGFSTQQASNAPYQNVDWDDFVIEVEDTGLLEFFVSNIAIPELTISLVDANENLLLTVPSEGRSSVSFAQTVSPGRYYLEIGSTPLSDSWEYPYLYEVFFTAASGLQADFVANMQEGCAPFGVQFTNQSQGTATQYQWTFEGGQPTTSSSPNPTVTYTASGVYDVTLKVSNNLGSQTVHQNAYIRVKERPETNFEAVQKEDLAVQFVNKTEHELELPNYLWEFGDGSTSTDISPTHNYTSVGTYTVQLTANNSCGQRSYTQTISVTVVDIEDIFVNGFESLELYPNPTQGSVKLRLEGKSEGLHRLTLLDPMGRRINEWQRNKSATSVEWFLDLGELPKGMYWMQVRSNETLKVKRLMIQY